MRICEEELLWSLKISVMVRLPAYNLVKRAFDDRENFHASKQILLMDGQGSPWKEFLFALEEEEGCKG